MLLRYERKYLVPFRLLDKLRERILPFVNSDIFAACSTSDLPQYTVRSIYLDTRNLSCHTEKIEGLELRRKFRIRSYNEYSPDATTVFEIKRKIQNRIKKNRAFTVFENVIPLMHSGNIDKYIEPGSNNAGLEDAKRFFFHVKMMNLIPTVLVTYEREAYHGMLDPGVRITFDKNVRSRIYPEYKMLFTENGLSHLFPGHFILEVKYYSDMMPLWIKSIINEFRLRHDAISKYAIGFDVNRPNHIFNY